MPGDNKQPLWQRILMGGAVAEAPSVMTAAGHKIEKDGTVTVENQNDAGVTQLRSTLPVIGASAAISVAAPTTLSTAWKVLNHPITQTIGTIDGFRNLFTGNGVQKTYNHFNNGEYGKGTLSLAGDVLDASPLIGIGKSLPYFYRYFKNTPVEQITTFDDVIDKGISYWKRQIDPNIKKSDYRINEYDIGNFDGEYYPNLQMIDISPKQSRWSQRNSLIHEMRHHDDYDLNYDNGYRPFSLEDMREFGKNYGRLKLNTNEQDLLKFTYRTLPIKERVAVNSDFRAVLEEMMKRTSQKIPSKSELDNYIQNLPWPVLSFGRILSGYPMNMSGAIFMSPNKVKSALINVK